MILGEILKEIGKFSSRYKKAIFIIFIAWFFWAFGLGMLGGWFLAKGSLSKFPEIKTSDRILILAPHIDDEIISSAGLIQETKAVGAKILIVYATNGDDNPVSLISKDKTYKPSDFVILGEQRMNEGKKALALLGLDEKNYIFLGYPDQGLKSMLQNPTVPYTSRSTRFNYNPYKGTFREQQPYTGENLESDLKTISLEFKPTIVILPHPRDNHSDHRSLFRFWEKVSSENQLNSSQYAYLVHFRLYPPEKKLRENEFLYPPKKLFTQEGWYSFDLSTEQQKNKLGAVSQNVSQLKMSSFDNFLRSFVRMNEIFEKIDSPSLF